MEAKVNTSAPAEKWYIIAYIISYVRYNSLPGLFIHLIFGIKYFLNFNRYIKM